MLLIWSDAADKTWQSEKTLLPSSVPSVPQLLRVCSVPDVSRRNGSSANCCYRLHAVSARSVSTCNPNNSARRLAATAVISAFEQVCTSPPIRLCVKSAAAVSSRSTGARKTATCAWRITTAPWEPCPTRQKGSMCLRKGAFVCFVTGAVVPSESWCKSHSVSRWCVLPRRQSGPQLLHGDLLP